ncbi:hypothetical protein JVT61DRAFT_453 [Boletus reticuloceps]|uniref:Uncharacterized protein n=1 Tax=Boletus reticuloceps TaxID=495285 RepID=A0A8I2Z363_9AGAM|nr:hypothetical protein JVT61DRAFT_453 [Boletus reticuloceps]
MDADTHRAATSSSLPVPSNPRKRKTPPARAHSLEVDTKSAKSSPTAPKGEYETGRVICEVCGEGVSFRDEATGGFTLKHWDAHRQQCANTTQSVPEPVIYTPESTAEALANPPPKRRRAKRSEEERIDYLRADPYVAQFEAYRVLCASCDKWIRLRPNSTYCSIPWDAHRKSCLSKKINTKNSYGLEERNSLLSKDPDVRKYDAERVLCNICDQWLPVSSENHMQAVQKWLQHRSVCQKYVAQSATPPTQLEPSSSSRPHTDDAPSRSAGPSELSALHAGSPRDVSQPTIEPSPTISKSGGIPGSPSSSFKDLTPTNFPPAHESRRRNAEQRAAYSQGRRACRRGRTKQSFLYPLQEMGAAQARQFLFGRRAQKAAQAADARARGGQSAAEDSLTDDDASAEDELDSDDGPVDGPESDRAEERRKVKAPIQESRLPPPSAKKPRFFDSADNRLVALIRKIQPPRAIRPKSKYEIDGVATVEPGTSANRVSRRLILGLADLDSVHGRMNFIFSSIAYLFMATYESTDDMTISSLLTYLNAAMPLDKHEDFDTAEVAKVVAALSDKGDIIFEGDTLRLPD